MPSKQGTARWEAAVRKLSELMAKLGFSEESIKVYLRLLLAGPMPNTKLIEMTGLSEAAVFKATQGLRRCGLIVGFRIRQANAWYVADPATAWLSMAAEATWSVTATLTPVGKLPRTGVKTIDERSELCRSAALPSLAVWSREVPDTAESRTARSADSLAQLAVETVRIAKAHVRSISASPKVSDVARFWPALVAQMEAGVRYTRLADLNEMYEHGLDVVCRDLDTGVELHIGLQSELTSARGYLADNRVLVRYAAAAPGERPTEGFMTSDKNAIVRFRRRFDRLAGTAVPAAVAIDHLALLADQLRGRAWYLSQDARDWLDELLRMGRFSKLPTEAGWTDEHRLRVESELVRSGLALRSAYGHFIAKWPDPQRTTAALRARHFG